MALLTTQHLTVGYTQGKRVTPLLIDLNLELQPGRLVALLGQNGAGKSTLLRTITGALQPLSGTVVVAGKALTLTGQRELSRAIGLVSTDRIAVGGLTVRELVALGRQPHTGFLGRLSHDDYNIVEQALQDVGITHKAGNYVAQLSDGERQKAMIARALAQQTPIIILDEPTAFLDVASRIEAMRLLGQLAHDRGKAVLLSSHDISQTLMMADDLWLITHDRQVIAAPAQDILHTDAMNRLFASRHITFNPAILDYLWQ